MAIFFFLFNFIWRCVCTFVCSCIYPSAWRLEDLVTLLYQSLPSSIVTEFLAKSRSRLEDSLCQQSAFHLLSTEATGFFSIIDAGTLHSGARASTLSATLPFPLSHPLMFYFLLQIKSLAIGLFKSSIVKKENKRFPNVVKWLFPTLGSKLLESSGCSNHLFLHEI